MLEIKIKDKIDLKELEKFGFIETSNMYTKPVFTDDKRIVVDKNSRRYGIDFNDCYTAKDIEIWTDTLYNLIQVGFVEKVKEK